MVSLHASYTDGVKFCRVTLWLKIGLNLQAGSLEGGCKEKENLLFTKISGVKAIYRVM